MGKDIITLIISILLLIISTGITFLTDYTLNNKHYLGIGLIAISLLFYLKSKELFFYVFGLTLILGTVNLIDIFYANIIFEIGPIKFNPIFLTLLIIFLVTNQGMLSKLFPKSELSEQDLAKRKLEKERMVKIYENKFQSKTELELKNIADENSGYVNEAKIASKNILRNKYVL
jgi:hypothetical protein